MQSSSVPLSTRQQVISSSALSRYGFPSRPSGASSGYMTVDSSWTSANALSSLGGDRPDPPLAWSGVRHQVVEEESSGQPAAAAERAARSCNQAVLLTCLHLSHEMALREVGLYAWTLPHVKDPTGSTTRIMKHYAQQLQDLSTHVSVHVRLAPDPSRASIQHHLQKARLAAGPEGYVAVIYAGHGIQEPPTEAGELWCYDKSFEECAQKGGGPSEYIPILLFDMLTWAGASTCYVWDSQNAGRFIRAALTEANEIDTQLRAAAAQNPSVAAIHPAVYADRQIHFAACSAHEILPRVPGLPDDLFTACLTTPLRIALLYHNLQTFPISGDESAKRLQKSQGYMAALLDCMSDKLQTRLWSELQAILYTIAWQNLNGSTYQRLFGSSGDVVSNLASGFLLAQRVMKTYRATPESIPSIPASNSHSLWMTWDLILDNLFEQLPPFFDEEGDVTAWEDDLTLVSFMDDQLASILESDRPLFTADTPRYKPGIGGVGGGGSKGLSRLPIICQAALASEFRARACVALDACLRSLDLKGLAHAVQGGVLDVAAQLLESEDEQLAGMMISIWSSLVRHDACVALLAASGRTAERLTSVPSVRFFLDALEQRVDDPTSDTGCITQTTAVLATIANYVAGRQAPRFVKRTLEVARKMLAKDESLVKQWGALLVAEVLSSISHEDEQVDAIRESLQAQLLDMVGSTCVEERATAVYALSRWIKKQPRDDILDAQSELELLGQIIGHAQTDGSGLVRKEIVNMLQRALVAGGQWTKLVLWTYIVDSAARGLPRMRDQLATAVKDVQAGVDIGKARKDCLQHLHAVLKVYEVLRTDSNSQVRTLVNTHIQELFEGIRAHTSAGAWHNIAEATFPELKEGVEPVCWSEALVNEVKRIGERLSTDWSSVKAHASPTADGNDLFEKSKLSLLAYLAHEDHAVKSPEQLTGKPESASDRGHQMRYRVLEDSLVVAEQQVGLPWKWAMKEISSPDPWSTLTFHSFLHTVMSCNNTQDLLMWDWSTSRKTGAVRLNLEPQSVITSARFVNELFERVVVLAEISNGDIHVLSATSDEPTDMKPISSFLALNMRKTLPGVRAKDKKLVTTWWRQSGKLCVGGPSDVVNIWDCPAERCYRNLETLSNSALTSLITEPVSGNLILGGFADGTVKLWDLRQSRKTPLMSWAADIPSREEEARISARNERGVLKLGVVLGESTHVTTATANGLVRVHDIRNTSSPVSSILAHPSGTSSASFQAHSGLMSTTANLDRKLHSGAVDIKWGIYRSTLSSLTTVTEDTFTLDNPFPKSYQGDGGVDVRTKMAPFAPYTVMHSLRPFLGVGYGTECVLRGSGVGKGDDTDSGSYTFLRSQSRQVDGVCG